MAQIDKIFQNVLSNIMDQDWEEQDRAKWADGSPVKIKRILHVCNTYDVGREFPLLSLRPVPLVKAVDEILWIWQLRSVNTHDLKSHIWDQWTDTEGKIPGCYGDMINRPVILYNDDKSKKRYGNCSIPLLKQKDINNKFYYNENILDINGEIPVGFGFYNQTDFILWSLKHDHTSRRILASMFDPATNNIKPLQECAFQIQLSVKQEVLHMVLYQRSCDTVTAFAWNVAQYAALLMMFAHDAGLKPGKLTHFIGDCHVYNRHEKQAKELLCRTDRIKPIPQVTISSRMNGLGFYDFTPEDFEIWNYSPDPQIKFEVAV